MTRVALSIAGSDSGAGAGIQADLKTFSALGVYGCTVITAITAQNTQEVSSIFEIGTDMIRKQINSVMADIPPDTIKIGMVYSNNVIKSISKLVANSKCPIVLDPILSAGSGAKLLLDNALEGFISELIPISTLITPNLIEAEKLTDVKIKGEREIIEAAYTIRKFGAKNVIIKGAHFNKEFVTDFLLDAEETLVKFSNPRLEVKESHGAGCNFSAAATAFLARGFSLKDTCRLANQYVHNAMKHLLILGRGLAIANPISGIYQDANRYNVLQKLRLTLDEIEALNNFSRLLPETQSNMVFALPDAKTIRDVAAVKGRIIKIGNMARPASSIEFGASKHVASAVLSYMTVDRSIRAGMNIKYDKKIWLICQSLFEVSDYDRRKEPQNIKKNEGMTITWGIKSALIKNPNAHVICHRGDIGKEPMIIIFGADPADVYNKTKKILENY
ncbi:MAG TPA: bifunctional hydroxymethylpyrimidine kinase/phosphomethylpyrimidine kinase [Nitrososphaeraceae archaeon]|nr:bifunctional hydroxymethylpyrimidine kinase/phosphomethylpyrimidine kinase [Nitrososphaeraceae archaeon]